MLNCKMSSNMKNAKIIDLRSDTVTKPSVAMRNAIATAEVGDDVYKEDMTTTKLEKRVAELLGKEDGLLVTSGTMGNLVSVMAHCWQRGDEVLMGDKSHMCVYEQGGIAAVANVYSRTLNNKDDGTFSIEELKNKISTSDNPHFGRTTLIAIENTHNICNGSVLDRNFINEVCSIAKSNGIKVHLDGARLFNASIKLGESPAQIVQNCDSATICLSKGLSCPMGSVVVGTKEFIHRARRNRKLLGGGMRQTGIIAAAGLFALENMVNRLADDHKHANMIATAIANTKNEFISVDLNKVHTNIVYIQVDPQWMNAFRFLQRLEQITDEEFRKFGEESVVIKMNARNEAQIRFLTHCDVSQQDVKLVIQKLKYIIDEEKQVV